MIKFSYHYPEGFIKKFKADFVVDRITLKATEVYEEIEANFPADAIFYKDFFTKSSILGFIFCKGKNLKNKIDQIYSNYPLIADRYCPAWIFNQYSFRFYLLDLDLSINANQTTLTNYKTELLVELGKVVTDFGSKLAVELITRLDSLRTARSISKIFSRIRYICLGRSRLANKIENQYPAWFKEIPKIFDYDKLRTDHGLDIINSANLKACPYCNARKIEVVNGLNAVGSPDLDHFHPKSQYPFLATTLSNFVPSCWYCNQKFKRETDTYQGYLHPLLSGTEKYNVFKFTPTLDTQPEILVQGCTKFKKNISMFELKAIYGGDFYKRTYADIEDLLDIQKEIYGSINAVVDNKRNFEAMFLIGRGKTTQNTIDYKFRLDVLSHLTHNNYRK